MAYRALPFPLPVVPPKFTPENVGAQNRKLAQQLYRTFFSWPIERSRKILETTPAEVWEREGQKRALQVFHAAAQRVPAYKDFLKKHKINHEKVRTIHDFKLVPPIDKKNYLQQYPLEHVSWDGVLQSSQIVSVSSGASGEPFFWPRGSAGEMETSYIFELLLSSYLRAAVKKTLFVNCWAMGMWVGGTITLNSVLRLAQKGLPCTVVTPGNVMEEILNLLPRLRPHYEHFVIAAYPPFLKDIIDEGSKRGIDWRSFSLSFLVAGESISETWRDYVAEISGGLDPECDLIGIYGTADAAALGHETPSSIRVRRLISRDKGTRQMLFNSERLPTLIQYYPTLRFFESVKNELVFTSTSTVPLVRYNIHDSGGVLYHDQVQSIEMELAHSSRRPAGFSVPYVYLFGRSDFTTTLYGANIYPEHIRAGLEQPALRRIVSGRFTMSTEDNRVHNQYLLVNVELASGVKPTQEVRRLVRNQIVQTLLAVNSEYRDVTKAVGKMALPIVRLFAKGHKEHFSRGTIKQKWQRRGR